MGLEPSAGEPGGPSGGRESISSDPATFWTGDRSRLPREEKATYGLIASQGPQSPPEDVGEAAATEYYFPADSKLTGSLRASAMGKLRVGPAGRLPASEGLRKPLISLTADLKGSTGFWMDWNPRT